MLLSFQYYVPCKQSCRCGLILNGDIDPRVVRRVYWRITASIEASKQRRVGLVIQHSNQAEQVNNVNDYTELLILNTSFATQVINMNAHCDQSPIVICNEKLYQFRIFELSEPFCERRNGNTTMSQSCDNVTQKLKQAERYKRISDSFTYYPQIRESNRHQKMCSRSQSLPIDLNECCRDTPRENSSKDHAMPNHHQDRHATHDRHARESSLRRKMNGFHKESIGNEICEGKHSLKDIRKEQRTKEEEDNVGFFKDCSRTELKRSGHGKKRNVVVADVISEDLHCIQIKSNLRELSSRYDKKLLENKSKPELISIIMELQDALRLATED